MDKLLTCASVLVEEPVAVSASLELVEVVPAGCHRKLSCEVVLAELISDALRLLELPSGIRKCAGDEDGRCDAPFPKADCDGGHGHGFFRSRVGEHEVMMNDARGQVEDVRGVRAQAWQAECFGIRVNQRLAQKRMNVQYCVNGGWSDPARNARKPVFCPPWLDSRLAASPRSQLCRACASLPPSFPAAVWIVENAMSMLANACYP